MIKTNIFRKKNIKTRKNKVQLTCFVTKNLILTSLVNMFSTSPNFIFEKRVIEQKSQHRNLVKNYNNLSKAKFNKKFDGNKFSKIIHKKKEW